MHWKSSTVMTPCLVTWFALGILSPAISQDVSPAGNQNMVTQFNGKLKGFQRGVVTVVREDETEVAVQLPDNIMAFQFIATAKPAFLQRGAMVRFKGTFNQAGASLSPITKVELFHPVQGKIAGRARQSFIPGVYPERQPGGQPLPAVAKCDVVGGLVGIDANGAITVQAGKRPVRAQLAADVKFEIRFNDLTLAQEGDPVSVAGFYQPPDDTSVKAESITVTTDRVYGQPKAEPPRRSSRRRTRSTDRANADGQDVEKKPASP